MSKLDLVRLYRTDNVPDHILQEVEDLITQMGVALFPVISGHSPNIVISAFNRLHAGLIVTLVTENGLKDAAQTEAVGLMKNVEHLSGMEIWGKDE